MTTTSKKAYDLDPDQIRDEALRLLDIIVAEFKSDPKSVQCFDERIVKRSIEIVDEYNSRVRRYTVFF